jgi:DNA-directed RNA polymerase II subunit RPB2
MEIIDEISQEESWHVIRSYFEQHGLVSQQISSYNRFLSYTVQDIVSENSVIKIIPQDQYAPGDTGGIGQKLRYEVEFGQVHVNQVPQKQESDEEIGSILPHEARVRNMTYETSIYIDVKMKAYITDEATGNDIVDSVSEHKRYFIGKVPVMLRSTFCTLNDQTETERVGSRECVYDQGGYFVINGGEKVIVAQERMANNFVYVFHKKQPSKYSWMAEIRSQVDSSNCPPNVFAVKLLSKGTGQRGSALGQGIYASIPYIKEDIPIVILFKALNCVSDKEILSRICYDKLDKNMMEAMKASLEESSIYQNQEDCLNFIGMRGSVGTTNRKERIQYTKDILEKHFLPHVSTRPNCESKKAYFVGYMTHRLINAALGRAAEDDRDHYGKKRLDMAGSLLGSLFRQLFRKLTKEAEKIMKKDVDEGKPINLRALKPRTITNGLRYALATGNWGNNRQGEVLKTGVAQVLNRLTFASSLSHLRRLNTPLQK